MAHRIPAPGHGGKAASAASCTVLEQIPNIGVSLAADLRSIGIVESRDLIGRDPHALYAALCERSGQRQDPCVLDSFMAATDFMGGAAPAPWWRYTAQRKAHYGRVEARPPHIGGHSPHVDRAAQTPLAAPLRVASRGPAPDTPRGPVPGTPRGRTP